MLDNSPASRLPPHVVGEGYDYQSVRAALGGQTSPPYFVIHRDGAILGLCLGLVWNPRAESDPGEVWVGRKEGLPGWGAKLAATTGPLPVYVRREEAGKWFFIGTREVTGSTTEPDALRQRLKPPLITGIDRVVFLKRSNSPVSPGVVGMAASPVAPPLADQPFTRIVDDERSDSKARIDPEPEPTMSPERSLSSDTLRDENATNVLSVTSSSPVSSVTSCAAASELKTSDPAPDLDVQPSPAGRGAGAANHEINSSNAGSDPVEKGKRGHPRDPLHGVTLEAVVTRLVERHGWAEMGRRIPIRCFLLNPSVKSSLTFLRRTTWARQKVEGWFISEIGRDDASG